MGSAFPQILIIDDDPGFVHELSAALSSAGFETASAADGSSAGRLLENAAFDLLIVDLVLPGNMSGFGVISILTRTEPPFKIIAASAVFRDPVLAYIATRLGVDECVEKTRAGQPFNGAAWVRTVRQVLGGASQAQRSDAA